VSTEPAAAAPRRPGRPRSAESHQAILRATLELLVVEGLRGLSIETIAQRAGVGKATIYRRWSSKEEIVAEAVSNLHAELPVPDTGTARGDFLALADFLVAASEARGGDGNVLARLLGEASQDAKLHEIFTANLVEPRRRAVRTILQRGIERGELRDDVDMDLMIDAVVGANIYRALISRDSLRIISRRAGALFDAFYEGLRRR
jgi:AcrR family transcriptional regulator